MENNPTEFWFDKKYHIHHMKLHIKVWTNSLFPKPVWTVHLRTLLYV